MGISALLTASKATKAIGRHLLMGVNKLLIYRSLLTQLPFLYC
jgi:hypothetical protein